MSVPNLPHILLCSDPAKLPEEAYSQLNENLVTLCEGLQAVVAASGSRAKLPSMKTKTAHDRRVADSMAQGAGLAHRQSVFRDGLVTLWKSVADANPGAIGIFPDQEIGAIERTSGNNSLTRNQAKLRDAMCRILSAVGSPASIPSLDRSGSLEGLLWNQLVLHDCLVDLLANWNPAAADVSQKQVVLGTKPKTQALGCVCTIA